MSLETCPAISRMTSSPAPLSARSVTNVWRLSWKRPLTFALVRAFRHAVFREVCGRVGSLGTGLPNGNTYQLARAVPNLPVYHFVYSTMAVYRSLFMGMVRPVPASDLL